MPVVRGIHAPALEPARSLLSNIPDLADATMAYVVENFNDVAASSGRGWTVWQRSDGRLRLTREALSKADFDFWLELFAQGNLVYSRQVLADWAMKVGLALHGVAFILEVALELFDLSHHSMSNVLYGRLPLLRQAIACADDDAHAAALEVAQRLRTRHPPMAMLCAHLFPHQEAWALESLQTGGAERSYLLLECVLPTAALVAHLERSNVYFYKLVPAAFLQVLLHGEAAFPVLAHLLKAAGSRDEIVIALDILSHMRVPQLIPTLVEHINSKEVRAALDKLSIEHPAAVMKAAIERSLATRSRTVEGWTVRLALRQPDALAQALGALDEGERSRFEAVLATLDTTEAPADKLPELLRNPPWLQKIRPGDLPTLDVAPLPSPLRLAWSDEQTAKYAAHKVSDRWARQVVGRSDKDTYGLAKLCIAKAAHARVLAGEPLQAGDVVPQQGFYGADVDMLMLLAPAAALVVWNGYPAQHWSSWQGNMRNVAFCLLARHGEAALPGLQRYVQSQAETGLDMVLPVDAPQLVPTAMHALRKLKKARAAASAWIKAHPLTTLKAAFPLAFGSVKAGHDDARFTLRWMAANGFEAQAREVAADYGPAMSAAFQALLDADPLLVLPARMPKLPSFFVAASFRRPALRDGGALPLPAIEHLGSMLAISTLEAPYAGLQVVRELCTPASLAEFAWDLFEAWNADGRANKYHWAFAALGLLGDDETARRLASKIREWPGESAHQRAVAGLDLLAAIGSDVALMHLNGIASKVKFKGLQDKARDKIAAVAEARGFTTEELADRLVPDLGLDEQGTLRLDFGPRQFVVAFDETLKPFVRDGQGTRLKDLPKPLKSDDAALAEAATERYKQIKKDAKAVGSLQLIRLEMGMVARRRWSATDFRLFFLEHPLMRHLAARVVWGVYVDGCMTQGFRVAEDLSLADENDELFTLPEDASVGLAHVLEMPAALQAAFGQVFADYEILQPFKQLGRETFGLSEAEKAGHEITRFKDKTVAIGSVMGLVNRGWERGAAEDGGWVHQFHKPLPGGLQADLDLDPGTVIGDLSYEPKQKLPCISLRKTRTWDKEGLVTFAALDPILASELLRDIELLAPFKETA